MATAKLLGASIKRREDPRFMTGKGNYTDDLKLPGMTYAAFVRSPHASAKIRKIDIAKAQDLPRGGGDLHRQGHDGRQLAAVRLAAPRAQGSPAAHASGR